MVVDSFYRCLTVVLLALLCCTDALAASGPEPSITMSIESEQVYAGDTVLIVIESIGLSDPLELSILSAAASFQRETTGTRIVVQQGKVVEVKLRRMEFIPDRTGLIVFGPVRAGDVVSNSVSIKVLDEVRTDWLPSDEDMHIDLRVSKTRPYIYSMLVLDIVLRHRHAIVDEDIILPSFTGFSSRTVFEKRRTFKDDSRDWRQIAWRYLLFPEQSGKISIGSVQWSGTAVKSRSERAVFDRQSATVEIDVRASTMDANQWWLPSDNLDLSESWSSELTTLKAGDEITRTISISASNVLAGQIPTPTVLESRALSQSLVSTDRQETLEADGILARAEFVYRVTAQSPIPVFLDTVRVPWWNTRLEQAEEAIIPVRRINVALPERADLLTELALADAGVPVFDQWWSQADRLRIGLYVLAVLCAAPALLLMLRAGVLRVSRQAQLSRRRRALQRLAARQEWSALSQALLPYAATKFDNADTLGTLEQLLYARDHQPIDMQRLHSEIKALNLLATDTGNDGDALAPL